MIADNCLIVVPELRKAEIFEYIRSNSNKELDDIIDDVLINTLLSNSLKNEIFIFTLCVFSCK